MAVRIVIYVCAGQDDLGNRYSDIQRGWSSSQREAINRHLDLG
jgi:hypothetical protein